MKVMPTMEGGLRLEIESASDWVMLKQIPQDATEKLETSLPEILGDLMDDESEWGDLVLPDLQLIFSAQLAQVASAVTEAEGLARDQGNGDEGELFIPRQEAEEWYGALNQARLALESRYQFGPTDEIDDLSTYPPAKRTAFIRSQFYCTLQSILLDYAID